MTTPVGAHAERLREAGVPLATIVSMIELHYADALRESERQLKEAIVGNLKAEALQDALAKAQAREAALQQQIAVAVDRAAQLQTYEASQARGRVIADAPVALTSDDAIAAAAEQQQQQQLAAGGGAFNRTGAPEAGRTPLPIQVKAQLEQLQRHLDSAKSELKTKSVALEKEKGQRRRFESDNHRLNMAVMGLHDELSKLARDAESAKTRLREHAETYDRDRQQLVAALADAKRELSATTQRSESEVSALSSHIAYLERELAALRRAHTELQEDFTVATSHQADAEASSLVADAMSIGISGEPSPASLEGSFISGRSPKHAAASLSQSNAQLRAAAETITALQAALGDTASRADAAEAESARLRRELSEAQNALARAGLVVPGLGIRSPQLLASISSELSQQAAPAEGAGLTSSSLSRVMVCVAPRPLRAVTTDRITEASPAARDEDSKLHRSGSRTTPQQRLLLSWSPADGPGVVAAEGRPFGQSSSLTPEPVLGEGPLWAASQGNLRGPPPPMNKVARSTSGPLGKSADGNGDSATPPPRRSKAAVAAHDGFRKGADPAALMRLRGPPAVVSIDGAAAFVANFAPARLPLRPRPDGSRRKLPPMPGPPPPAGDAADGAR